MKNANTPKAEGLPVNSASKATEESLQHQSPEAGSGGRSSPKGVKSRTPHLIALRPVVSALAEDLSPLLMQWPRGFLRTGRRVHAGHHLVAVLHHGHHLAAHLRVPHHHAAVGNLALAHHSRILRLRECISLLGKGGGGGEPKGCCRTEQQCSEVRGHTKQEHHRRVGKGCVVPCRSRWSPYH